MVDFAKHIAANREKYNLENRPTNNLHVSITVAGSDYAISFGYDKALIAKFTQAIPDYQRRWIKDRKTWLVTPEAAGEAVGILVSHTGRGISVPNPDQLSQPEVMEKSFLLEYIGATKERGDRKSAYGFVNGDWNAEFPEAVLKEFFEGREAEQKPDGLQTLYQILCVVENADSDQIRKAYKRLAMHNHPDVSQEENAHEKFIQINEAYKVLIDPEKRQRYDAGLYFERQDKEHKIDRTALLQRRQERLYGYRAPLRCGQITARGTVRLMRFVVSEILKWDDVINREGKTMVSTWPKDADTFQTLWV